MKKTQKQIFGLFGLGFVAAMTFVAATLPAPGASAINEVTDVVTVTVVGNNSEIIITNPTGNVTELNPDQDLEFTYQNVDEVKIKLTFRGIDGTTQTIEDYQVYHPTETAGSATLALDFDSLFGFGEYQFDIVGTGTGAPAENSILINYVPIIPKVDVDEDGVTIGETEYATDEEGNPKVIDHISVDVYPDGGAEALNKDPFVITPPEKSADIPMEELSGGKSGTYIVRFSVYDEEGNLIYYIDVPYTYEYVPVPDTGAFFNNLNISKEDYLTTGLIIFFIFAIVGFGIVARDRNSGKNNKRR